MQIGYILFFYAFSDVIVEDISEIGEVLVGLDKIVPKDISILEEAMNHCLSVEESRRED